MLLQSHETQKAADLLKEGKLVAFPTETVYGLGACVFHADAIKKIFEVKKRPQDNPLIVHISNYKQLALITQDVPENFYLLAKAFFPGPLTVLLPKNQSVPSIVSAGLPTIGVRMPSHCLALQLIEEVGMPLVAPSANLSGKPSSTTALHVFEDFGETISAVLDGGPCSYGIESTVVALTPAPFILRPGVVTQQQIEEVLQCPVFFASKNPDRPNSPGMKYRHYAPRAKLTLLYSLGLFETYSQSSKEKKCFLKNFASNELYALLRHADTKELEEIVVYCDEEMQNNPALMDRMLRASQELGDEV